ncbi:unnamed protein product [Orchesella dallaii]|uniref:UNC93-like protein MFSD11 n=1 Tax=Orchesella dallaii TaxID=48710 RepID=A0ABP1S8J9_9HEXA
MEEKEVTARNLRNVIILSIGCMLLTGAHLTTCGVQQAILQSMVDEDPSSVTADGYIALSIINGVFSIANFVAPLIVSTVGVRTTMIVGTISNALFIAAYLYPKDWVLYGASALLGFTAASVWVANGTYFTRCSTKETIGKNMGIYWVVQSMGMVIGHSFIFWQFQGRNHIDYETRFLVISVLTCISAAATITFFFLGSTSASGEIKKEKEKTSICHLFTEPFQLLASKHMLLLIPPALWNGFEIAFFAGIYPTAVGFTEGFGGDTRKLVGVAGILIGIGTLLGGLIFGVFAEKTANSKRSLVVVIAFISHLVSIILIFINHPNSASQGPTKDVSVLTSPSVSIAMVSAFLLGLGDGCLQPQIFAGIGVIWPDHPGAALALCRFFQGAAIAVGFFTGSLTGLRIILGVFLCIAGIGTLTFCVNERLIDKRDRNYFSNIDPVMQIKVLSKKASICSDSVMNKGTMNYM